MGLFIFIGSCGRHQTTYEILLSAKTLTGDICIINAKNGSQKLATKDRSIFPIFTCSRTGDRIVVVKRNEVGGNTELWLIDLRSGKEKRLTQSLHNEDSPVLSPDGKKLAFASDEEGNWNVYIMDLETNDRWKLLIPDEGRHYPEDWTADGKKLLCCSDTFYETKPYIVNVESGKVERLIKKPGIFAHLRFSPDERKVVYVYKREPKGKPDIYLFDIAENREENLTNHPSRDIGPCFSPDGKKIAFLSDRESKEGNFYIYIMNLEGKNVKRLTPVSKGISYGKIYWVKEDKLYTVRLNANREELYIMDRRTEKIRCLTRNFSRNETPCFSPDGKKIAYVSLISGATEIFIMDIGTWEIQQLTHDKVPKATLSWAPYGEKLAFVAKYSPRRHGIYILDLRSREVKLLSAFDGLPVAPVWSPDGNWLAFTLLKNKKFGLYIMSQDGKILKQLMDTSSNYYFPSFSPDGKKLAFSSDRDGNDEIYVVDLEGRNLRRLTENSALDYLPCWSPDGREIIFISDREGVKGLYVMDTKGKNVKRLPLWNELVPTFLNCSRVTKKKIEQQKK